MRSGSRVFGETPMGYIGIMQMSQTGANWTLQVGSEGFGVCSILRFTGIVK